MDKRAEVSALEDDLKTALWRRHQVQLEAEQAGKKVYAAVLKAETEGKSEAAIQDLVAGMPKISDFVDSWGLCNERVHNVTQRLVSHHLGASCDCATAHAAAIDEKKVQFLERKLRQALIHPFLEGAVIEPAMASDIATYPDKYWPGTDDWPEKDLTDEHREAFVRVYGRPPSVPEELVFVYSCAFAKEHGQRLAAERRRKAIMPLLEARDHLSIYRWEKDAGVTSKVGQHYLDGKSFPRPAAERRLANVINLSELPG